MAISGEKHYLYGRHHTDETKQKIASTLKNKYGPGEHPNCGKSPSEETRQKMRDAKLGKETGRGNPVYCIELDCQWSTIAKAQKETGARHIYSVLKGDRNYSGRHPETGAPLHWMLVSNM